MKGKCRQKINCGITFSRMGEVVKSVQKVQKVYLNVQKTYQVYQKKIPMYGSWYGSKDC